MVRISASVSLCFTLLAIGGALGACSSESTDGGGTAGSGSSSGSGSGSGSNNSGGTKGDGVGGTSSSAGTSNGTGGGRAGGTSVGGTTGSCTPGQVTCVDEATAATCDSDTGETVTVTCVDLKDIGIESTACVGDATSGNCDGEFADAECLDGATVFAICGQFSEEQFLNTYINCFQNNNDLQTPIRCVGPFLAASGVEADCEAAAAECLEEAGVGGAGAGGAGG